MVEHIQSNPAIDSGLPDINFCNYFSRSDELEHHPVYLAFMVDTFIAYILKKPIDLIVYVWVSAQKSLLPSCTFEESIKACYKYFGLDPKIFKMDAVTRQFHRNHHRFFKEQKSKPLIETTHAATLNTHIDENHNPQSGTTACN